MLPGEEEKAITPICRKATKPGILYGLIIIANLGTLFKAPVGSLVENMGKYKKTSDLGSTGKKANRGHDPR